MACGCSDNQMSTSPELGTFFSQPITGYGNRRGMNYSMGFLIITYLYNDGRKRLIFLDLGYLLVFLVLLRLGGEFLVFLG